VLEPGYTRFRRINTCIRRRRRSRSLGRTLRCSAQPGEGKHCEGEEAEAHRVRSYPGVTAYNDASGRQGRRAYEVAYHDQEWGAPRMTSGIYSRCSH
jgi:hypothetical protein